MNSKEALEILYKNCPMVVTRESDGVQLYSEYLTEVIKQDLDILGRFEKELGISLLILFKAIGTKIYAKAHHYKTGKPSILDFEEPRLIKHEEWCLVGTCGTFTYCVALKDYGKTWALCREDLKSE